jgi:DNA modification methylase
MALTAVKVGSSTFNSSYDNGIYEFPISGGKDRFHPTQKSLPLFEELVKKHSKEGDLILDCFSGSGTTAIAALKNNRKFIGCEIDEEYYTKSINRISSLGETV